MDLITLIVVLVFVGIALYLINAYVPMEPNIKRILNIAVIIFVLALAGDLVSQHDGCRHQKHPFGIILWT